VNSARVIADTSVLVNYLTGGAENDDPKWLDHSKWIFEAHDSGAHKIVVPAIVIAEVAGCGEVRGNHLDRRIKHQRITRVRKWIAKRDFLPVEISQTLAEEATELAITYQLTGADACILAAAVRHDCRVLYTWDRGLLKVGNKVNGVQVQQPERMLPDQGELEFGSAPDTAAQE
jgi:predicted nucleic acid-binding protein